MPIPMGNNRSEFSKHTYVYIPTHHKEFLKREIQLHEKVFKVGSY